MELVERVLAGSINKGIVADINECGGLAVRICRKDGNLILARKVTEMRDPKTGELLKVDLKQVGEPAKINVMVLEQLRRADVIPVVAPIGFGVDDELTYNINADTSAGAIAGAMRAKRLLFLTDVPGVLDKNGQLIGDMTVEQARGLVADGTISGGMMQRMEERWETMYAGRGIGLAARQVGVLKRVIVLDIDREDVKTGPLLMANPEIVEASDEDVSYEEGCLSVPEHYSEVVRPAKVKVRYLDRDGVQQEMACEGLLATCVQHEIDHLDGILFIDHISALKRNMILRKLLNARKANEREEAEGRPAAPLEATDRAHTL